jgi:LmbE family N-acetylglucosaminyl deacetylase
MHYKNILVIVAHPDDEVLGCGGTIARHTINGEKCYVLIMAEGITSRDVTRNHDLRKDKIQELRIQTEQAGRILGVDGIEFNSFPDNRMDGVDLLDVVKKIEEAIDKYRPEIIYTHHFGDLNIDHQITAKAVETATRPVKGDSVKEIYSFETPSSTEWAFANPNHHFRPNCYTEIEKTLSKKIEAFECYHGEKRTYPHPRSSEALANLAKTRGAEVGLKAAEAFTLIRKIG